MPVPAGRQRARWASIVGVLVAVAAAAGLVVVATPASAATTWRQVSTGRDSTCGVKTDGSLWCWGDNTYGQLGLGDTKDRLTPTRVGRSLLWQDVTVGANFACARKRQVGERWCWGANDSGKLGLGNTGGSVDEPTLATVGEPEGGWRSLSAGANHACGITIVSRDVYCWGSGGSGRLGVGDSASRNRPALVDAGYWLSIAPGERHTCAVKTNGDAYCWGDNEYGQLGQGDTTNRDEPVLLSGWGGTDAWTDITVGGYFSCGIRDNELLLCWGRNTDSVGNVGVLGTGHTAATRTIPTPVDSRIASDLNEVDAGLYYFCAIGEFDEAYCWGNTEYGQAGIYIDWLVECTSDCNDVLAGTHPLSSVFPGPVDDITAGGYHTCGIRGDGELWCWGRNHQGQLGQANRDDNDEPAQVG